MEFGTDNIIFAVIFIIAMVYFTINAIRLISYLQKAKPENRLDNIPKRIMQTLTIAIFQKKILRDKVAGPIHAGIFWGFLILLFSALNSIFTGFGIEHAFNFLGPVFFRDNGFDGFVLPCNYSCSRGSIIQAIHQAN